MKSGDRIQDAGTVKETEERMRLLLRGIVPDEEIAGKAALAFEINRLKRERKAVVLGHNYMTPALFASVPDYVGDSLQLARISAKTNAEVIVFCGVQFMAETAKVLNPEKTVLLPREEAGCSLAEGISVEDIRMLRHRFPNAPVVTYVNTFADAKAESDYCCTSGNSSAVIRHLVEEGHSRIIFVPDEYLGRNTANEVGVGFVEGWNEADEGPGVDETAIVGWKAHCVVHEEFTVEQVGEVRRQYPEAVLIAHPECHPDVVVEMDVVGSTKKMVEYIPASGASQFMLFTECSMVENLAVEHPDKEMVRMFSQQCEHMAIITLEDTLAALEKMQYETVLPEEVIERARLPIDRMLAIT